jgi:hypothetical protein
VGTRERRCDLKWSPDCDNHAVERLGPEYACAACAALCERCQQHEWRYQVTNAKGEPQRICVACATVERHVA